MPKYKLYIFIYIVSALVFLCSTPAYANNLSVSNVSLEERDPASGTLVVKFDLMWDNSWKTKINHDAVWLTVRLSDPSQTPIAKKLCDLKAEGLNPTGTELGSNTNLEMYVPEDKKGAFVRQEAYGSYANVSSTGMELTVDYESCGFTSESIVNASVFGIEMVYVPEGEFYAGDNGTSSASFVEGSADNNPWYISSESAVSVSNPANNGHRYVSAGNIGEDATGTSFTVPVDFPKGYKSFYAMKYEITEGDWVEFVNSLGTAAARANRDITDNNHKNADSVQDRNTISCSGNPLACSTDRPYRAVGYLNWMDVAAFLDWAALRPMTELEFEKASRGPLLPVNGEFVWGSANITAATTITGTEEDGTETIATSNANANYDASTFSGGDSANGAEYSQGPVRSGIFATGDSTRETSGAGYYGMMELSGNVAEQVVTVGNSMGRLFEGSQGDGVLTDETGFEGNANQIDWPGIDGNTPRGVTGADGAGVRGGSFADQSSGAALQISDRQNAANGIASAASATGGRGVRTYDAE